MKFFLFGLAGLLVASCIITFIAWAPVVQVLCYGYDAFVLGLANCLLQGLADLGAKSITA